MNNPKNALHKNIVVSLVATAALITGIGVGNSKMPAARIPVRTEQVAGAGIGVSVNTGIGAGLVIPSSTAFDINSQMNAVVMQQPLTVLQKNLLFSQLTAIVNSNLGMGQIVDATLHQQIIDANVALSRVSNINGQPLRTITASDLASTTP